MRERRPIGKSRRTLGLALAAAAALAGACATKEIRTYTLPSPGESTGTWRGRTLEEVLDAWGPPTSREPDGEGGTLLTYKKDTGVSVSVRDDPRAAPPGPAPGLEDPGGGVSGRRATQPIERVVARFWLDADGTVTRFWLAPEAFREGKEIPPEPGDGEPEAEE